MHRARNASQKRLAAAFLEWGIPTSEAILNVCQAAPQLQVIASGGLRSGVDIAQCIAMGACLGGMAGPFLKAAARSLEETVLAIAELQREIQVCMFAAGAGDFNRPLFAWRAPRLESGARFQFSQAKRHYRGKAGASPPAQQHRPTPGTKAGADGHRLDIAA